MTCSMFRMRPKVFMLASKITRRCESSVAAETGLSKLESGLSLYLAGCIGFEVEVEEFDHVVSPDLGTVPGKRPVPQVRCRAAVGREVFRIIDDQLVRDVARLEVRGERSNGIRGAVAYRHEQQHRRIRFLRRSGELLAQGSAVRPGLRSSGLIDGDFELGAAADREHRNDAAERPSHDADSVVIGEGDAPQVRDRGNRIVGFRFQAVYEPRFAVGSDVAGEYWPIGAAVTPSLGDQHGEARRGEHLADPFKWKALPLASESGAVIVNDDRKRTVSVGFVQVRLNIQIAALVKDLRVGPSRT